MGVVLLEGARAHQSVQGASGFIAVADAELGVAKWQVSPGPKALVEYLDVAGTRHRLERHGTLAFGKTEHVCTELLPMAALNPKLSGQKLGSSPLGISHPAHLAAALVFPNSIKRCSPRIPAHPPPPPPP